MIAPSDEVTLYAVAFAAFIIALAIWDALAIRRQRRRGRR